MSRRRYGVALVGLGAVGTVASAELVMAEIAKAKDPGTALACDLGAFVSCEDSLATWQGHLLAGLPNGIPGLVAFAAMMALGAVIAADGRVPRPLRLAMAAGGVGGLALVAFFSVTSAFVFHVLCPWCVVTWAVTIPASCLMIAASGSAGDLGGRMKGAWGWRWPAALTAYVAVVAVVVIGMWDTWVRLL